MAEQEQLEAIRERARERERVRANCGALDSQPFQYAVEIDYLLSLVDQKNVEIARLSGSDEVLTALLELREMDYSEVIIESRYAATSRPDGVPSLVGSSNIGIYIEDKWRDFNAPTLAGAMQKIRNSREQQP